MTKIDPPNWYSSLPQPLLLLHGTGLSGAHITLSDRTLRVTRTTVSANGHWAQLEFSTAPARPETLELDITVDAQNLQVPYRFEAPRQANDGAGGFSARDVLYLVMTRSLRRW